MPAIVTLPRAPETSIGRLGDVLLGSATEYSRKQQFDTREARLRAERLTDVENDRTYARTEGDRQYQRGREDRLSDVASDRTYEGTIHGRNRNEKLSDVEDERDWVMRVKQWERLERDNVAGLKDAQTRLNQLANDEAAVMQRMTAREQSLGAPEPQPNPAEIEKAAIQRAAASIPKAKWYETQRTVPTREEIAAQVPSVTDEVRMQINAAWQRARLDNQEQQRIDAVQLQRLGAEKNVITNVFRRVGIADGSTAPTAQAAPAGQMRNLTEAPAAGAPAATPNLATAQQAFASEIANAVRGSRGMTERQPQGAPNPLLPAEFRPSVPTIDVSGPGIPSPQSQLAEPAAPAKSFFSGPGTAVRRAGASEPIFPNAIWNTGLGDVAPTDPMSEARTLRTRLVSIADQTSQEAQVIRSRLQQLEQSLAQVQTRSAQLIDPMNSAVESVPAAARRGMASRFSDPGY